MSIFSRFTKKSLYTLLILLAVFVGIETLRAIYPESLTRTEA
jgi:hypothetical protein